MNSSLRPVTADDVPILERWIVRGDAMSFMSRWSPHSFSQGRWPDDLTRWHMIIAGGREVGTMWMERHSGSMDTCDLGIWIFDPVLRGHGLGSEAIRLAEEDSVACWGIDLVRLRVRESNTRAISCYQRAGYRVLTIESKEIEGATIRVLHMEHHLSLSGHQQAEQRGEGDSAKLRASP